MKRIENLSKSAKSVLIENLTGGENSYMWTEYNGGVNPTTCKEFATQEEYTEVVITDFLNNSEWLRELVNEMRHDMKIIGSDDPELIEIYTEIIEFIEGFNAPEPDALVLNKCAYIFHWSNNNFSWNRSHYEQKTKIQTILKRYYDNWNGMEQIPYIIKDNTVYIEVDGIDIAVNDKMIYRVYGSHPRKDIINGIRFADRNEFMNDRTDCHIFCQDSIHHNTLKSLRIDILGGEGGLRYYRIYFKENRYIFVVSGGKIYAHADKYTEIKKSDILSALDTKPTSKAGKFIFDFCEFITK